MSKFINLYVRPEDEQYLETMKNEYVSNEEKQFFEVMSHKIHHEPAPANDLIMHEDSNDDGIYIVRCYDSEFINGKHKGQDFAEEVHAMTLKEAMNTNFKECHFSEQNITLIDWLRHRNYAGVEYDHNYNLL